MSSLVSTVNPVDLYEIQEKWFYTHYHYWVEHVLFSFNWWFLLLILIIPWILWWILVDRSRLFEMITLGFFVATTAALLDSIGVIWGLWTYESKLIQMLPELLPIDYSLLPVCHMLIYQWFPRWRNFVLAHIILSAGGAFIAEPLFVWMNIYELHEWKHIYSFPIYIAIGVILKWFVSQLKRLTSI
ncbi:CBO0543 family protein [Halobacillus ihumii]|uniref:CBO0543 family protein n=1 Tax=Halobacillus ihumii TaxID=2686092 RepID=UPI0013D6B8F0|nr:CBO0543 family protein [Halobacillus ihumii]